MKLPFDIPRDGKTHRYCLQCWQDGVGRELRDGAYVYPCPNCGRIGQLAAYFDQRKAWLDADRELWHESVGVFVRRTDGRFLFFLRNEYPRQLTIPAGHLDNGMAPAAMARAELHEEAGIGRTRIRLVANLDILDDPCSAAANKHRWHVYRTTFKTGEQLTLGDESSGAAQWLTLPEALAADIVPPVRYIIERYQAALSS